MTQQEFEGTIESKQEKMSSNGKTYFSLKVGGRGMSAWDGAASIVRNLPLGQYVKGTLDSQQKDGRTYNNLVTIAAAEPQKGAQSAGMDTGARIYRSVALQQAVAFCAVPGVIKEGGNPPLDIVLAVAEQFETWLNREDKPEVQYGDSDY